MEVKHLFLNKLNSNYVSVDGILLQIVIYRSLLLFYNNCSLNRTII